MTPWEVVDRRLVHDGHVRLRVDTVTLPDGRSAPREVAEPDDAVAVVAVGDDDSVVLVRQYRHPIGRGVLELPAGKLDVDGESATEAAARELAEECHLAAHDWTTLTTLLVSPGWTSERVTLVRASGLRPAPPPDGFVATAEEATMEVVRIPLDAAVRAVREGTITDAKTVVGLLLVERT